VHPWFPELSAFLPQVVDTFFPHASEEARRKVCLCILLLHIVLHHFSCFAWCCSLFEFIYTMYCTV
jgi:hypothetical protein